MSGELQVVWEGLKEFAGALDAIIAASDLASKVIVTSGGAAIAAAARAHIDGRPGPNNQSGDLAGSTKVRNIRRTGPGEWQSETGPATPYGRRIELGFHGADSLGRVYDQPAFPFLHPGLIDAEAALAAIYKAAWRAALLA